MNLDYQKEIIPVIYGDSAVKILPRTNLPCNKLCFGTHWHDRIELIRVVKGTLFLTLASGEFIVNAGELAVIPPCQPHGGYSGSEGTGYDVIMFELSAFLNETHAAEKYLKPILGHKVSFKPVTKQSEIIALADRILSQQNDWTDGSALQIVGNIYELIGLLYRYQVTEKKGAAATDDRLQNVLDYINVHFSESISSKTLSQKFGYDEAYFCRRFKTVTGLSPMQYIEILRLELAQKEIKSNNRSISEIAVLCGFSDISYFTRRFKKHFNMTPSEYAQKNFCNTKIP